MLLLAIFAQIALGYISLDIDSQYEYSGSQSLKANTEDAIQNAEDVIEEGVKKAEDAVKNGVKAVEEAVTNEGKPARGMKEKLMARMADAGVGAAVGEASNLLAQGSYGPEGIASKLPAHLAALGAGAAVQAGLGMTPLTPLDKGRDYNWDHMVKGAASGATATLAADFVEGDQNKLVHSGIAAVSGAALQVGGAAALQKWNKKKDEDGDVSPQDNQDAQPEPVNPPSPAQTGDQQDELDQEKDKELRLEVSKAFKKVCGVWSLDKCKRWAMMIAGEELNSGELKGFKKHPKWFLKNLRLVDSEDFEKEFKLNKNNKDHELLIKNKNLILEKFKEIIPEPFDEKNKEQQNKWTKHFEAKLEERNAAKLAKGETLTDNEETDGEKESPENEDLEPPAPTTEISPLSQNPELNADQRAPLEKKQIRDALEEMQKKRLDVSEAFKDSGICNYNQYKIGKNVKGEDRCAIWAKLIAEQELTQTEMRLGIKLHHWFWKRIANLRKDIDLIEKKAQSKTWVLKRMKKRGTLKPENQNLIMDNLELIVEPFNMVKRQGDIENFFKKMIESESGSEKPEEDSTEPEPEEDEMDE